MEVGLGHTDSPCPAPAGGGRAGFKSNLRHSGATFGKPPPFADVGLFLHRRTFITGAWDYAGHCRFLDGYSMVPTFKARVGGR